MGAAASEASKQLAHAVSFGVNLAVLTNLAQMVFWKSHRRKGSRMNRHGPTALVLAAVPLAMLDQTRHVLQDGGVWTDSRNRIYVADMFNGRGSIFQFLGGS